MGYMHIENLYRPEAQDILLLKECYALEKIHGTSARVVWRDGKVGFSSGGVLYEAFCALFQSDTLAELFTALGHERVTIYGEAYGGKCQGMSATYGKELRFTAFEVQIGEIWLAVPNADDVCRKLGIEFVHYLRIPAEIDAIDAQRDADSIQAQRCGILEPRIREGVVLRPLVELVRSNGERLIAKHKRAEFAERKTIPDIDPAKRELMEKADDIALEFVTDMRLTHVLDAIGNPSEFKDIPRVIEAMIEDVTREASGEIVDNKAVRKAIGARAVKLYKSRITTLASAVLLAFCASCAIPQDGWLDWWHADQSIPAPPMGEPIDAPEYWIDLGPLPEPVPLAWDGEKFEDVEETQ